MIRLDLFTGLMERAFRLAYFICLDRSAALRVVENAMMKLEVAAAAQVKRLYYVPANKSDVTRSKVILSDKHLLQRLVYIELEHVEREKEAARSTIAEETVVVHFIKHLVRITMRRNSFYVTLGISRLLHDYTTTEAMEIYNIVVQDPERVKDDYYYRSRKALLMDELKRRFGDLVELTRAARGEERFKSNGSSRAYAELVEECLKTFTPWDTPCLIPSKFDPTGEEIEQLTQDGRKDLNAVETNRMHAVIDPACYQHIAEALRLPAPTDKLNIPHFILPKGGGNVNGPRSDRRRTSRLTEAELEVLAENLKAQSARRKSSYAGLLAIAVDGSERATIDLNHASATKLSLSDDDELIEVRAVGRGGDDDDGLLLATYLVPPASPEQDSRAIKSEIVIEGGQKIGFVLTSGAANGTALIEVSYRETNLWQMAARAVRRAAVKTGLASQSEKEHSFPVLKTALVTLLLLLAGGGLWLALRQESNQSPEISSRQSPSPQNSRPEALTTPTPVRQPERLPEANNQLPTRGEELVQVASTPRGMRNRRRNQAEQIRRMPRDNSASPQETARRPQGLGNESPATAAAGNSRPLPDDSGVRISNPNEEDSKTTRDAASQGAVTTLAGVRKIFVESISPDPRLPQLEKLLNAGLNATSKLIVVSRKDDADAVLKLSAPQTKRRKAAGIIVRLVNEDGEVIWPAGKRSSIAYTGTLQNISQTVIDALLKERPDK